MLLWIALGLRRGDQRAEPLAFSAESPDVDEDLTDVSWALRSKAEVGLSARTRVMTGHCSNAGGLSAVRQDPLYTIA